MLKYYKLQNARTSKLSDLWRLVLLISISDFICEAIYEIKMFNMLYFDGHEMDFVARWRHNYWWEWFQSIARQSKLASCWYKLPWQTNQQSRQWKVLRLKSEWVLELIDVIENHIHLEKDCRVMILPKMIQSVIIQLFVVERVLCYR